MKKKIKWAIIILVLAGISYGLYSFGNPPAPETAMENNDAITFPVTRETLVNSIEVKGKSGYEQETFVHAPFGAEVRQWNVKDGQQIKKGDVLFQLDSTALENEIAQTQATIKKQRLEMRLTEVQSALGLEDQALGATEADRKKVFVQREAQKLQEELSEVTLDIQERDIADKQKKLSEANYRAPASGIFLFEDPKKIPSQVNSNDRLGKIVDLNKLQLVSLVGEQDVFRIAEGMPVEVKINALKQVKLTGKVIKVSKFAKAGTDEKNTNQPAQFEVIIGLEPNKQLIAGLSLTGQIETERKDDAIVVPTVAVLREKDQYYVFLDKGNGQVERRDIKIGMETPEKTEVLEGLKEGDQVVLQ